MHAEDSCIISFDFGTTLEQCLQDCDLDPTCQADTYGYHYVECMLLRCYDLSTRYGLHALLFDSFIKACPQGVLGKSLGQNRDIQRKVHELVVEISSSRHHAAC